MLPTYTIAIVCCTDNNTHGAAIATQYTGFVAALLMLLLGAIIGLQGVGEVWLLVLVSMQAASNVLLLSKVATAAVASGMPSSTWRACLRCTSSLQSDQTINLRRCLFFLC
jgi:hypothetical protein